MRGNAADIAARAWLAVPPAGHGKAAPSGDGAAERGAHHDPAPPASRSGIADDRPSRDHLLRPVMGDCMLRETAEHHGIGATARASFSGTGRFPLRPGRAGAAGTMTPGAFISKWRASGRGALQVHHSAPAA